MIAVDVWTPIARDFCIQFVEHKQDAALVDVDITDQFFGFM